MCSPRPQCHGDENKRRFFKAYSIPGTGCSPKRGHALRRRSVMCPRRFPEPGRLTHFLSQSSHIQRPLSCLAGAHTQQSTTERHIHQAENVPPGTGISSPNSVTRGSGHHEWDRVAEQEGKGKRDPQTPRSSRPSM